MLRFGCLPLVLFFILLALFPVLFGQVMLAALVKLRIGPEAAVILVLGIILGSVINLPVKRIIRDEPAILDPFALFGLRGIWPRFQRYRRETLIAVNVGGCLIPSGVALYEVLHLMAEGAGPLLGLMIAVLINTVVCYRIAKPVHGVGIVMPGLIPPLIAILGALAFAPDHATPVAFVAGVMGPLLGADLLHLRDISRISTGMASIGGAGTFDGIVLSGILAAYLA